MCSAGATGRLRFSSGRRVGLGLELLTWRPDSARAELVGGWVEGSGLTTNTSLAELAGPPDPAGIPHLMVVTRNAHKAE